MPWDWEIHALQCDHISGRVDEFNDATGLINKYDGVVFCNIWQDQVRFIFLCKSCLNENHRILQQHPYYSFNGTRSWFIADDREKFEEKMNDLIEAELNYSEYVSSREENAEKPGRFSE